MLWTCNMFVESWNCGPFQSRSNFVLSASRAGSRPATPALSEALHWRIGPGGIAWPPEVADDPRAVDSPPHWGGWNPEAGNGKGSTGKKDGKIGEIMENLKDLDETLGSRKSITKHVAIIVFLFGSWCIILYLGGSWDRKHGKPLDPWALDIDENPSHQAESQASHHAEGWLPSRLHQGRFKITSILL